MGCCGSHNWTDFFNHSLYESEASTGSQPMCARVPLSCCVPAIGKSTYAAPGGRGGMMTVSGEPWLSLTPANRAGCCDGSESSSTGRYSQVCTWFSHGCIYLYSTGAILLSNELNLKPAVLIWISNWILIYEYLELERTTRISCSALKLNECWVSRKKLSWIWTHIVTMQNNLKSSFRK